MGLLVLWQSCLLYCILLTIRCHRLKLVSLSRRYEYEWMCASEPMRYGQSVWGTSSWPAQWLLLHSTWDPSPETGKLPKMQLPRWHLSFGYSTVRRGKSPREDHILYERRKGRRMWEMSSEHTWFLRKVLKNDPSEFWQSGGLFHLWKECIVPVQSETTAQEGRAPKLLFPCCPLGSGSSGSGLQPCFLSPGLAGLPGTRAKTPCNEH